MQSLVDLSASMAVVSLAAILVLGIIVPMVRGIGGR